MGLRANPRARRRVRGAAPTPETDLARQREVVDAFLAASREGDFGALLAVLDPDVVLRVDYGVASPLKVVRGAEAVASQALGYSQRGLFVRPALVNGTAGLVSTRDGRSFSVGAFTVADGKIVQFDILTDPERLRRLDLRAILDG